MKNMIPKSLLKVCLFTTLVLAINADLPSCERVKCHHCKINFIVEKCPEICDACAKNLPIPGQRRIQRPTYVVAAQQIHELFQGGNSGLLRPISEPDLSRPISSLQQQEPQTVQINLKAVYNNGELQQKQQFTDENVQAPILVQPAATSALQSSPVQLPATISTNPYQLQKQFIAPQQQAIQSPPYITTNLQVPQQSIPPPPVTIQQTPAFNPFQPFLTQTFSAIPGVNLPSLFVNPYTPFPLPTTAPVTPIPIQYAQSVPQQQLPYQSYQNQQQQTNQYYRYPINDGHPSVLQKSQPATTTSAHAQKTPQSAEITHSEQITYGPQVQLRQNSFSQQISIPQTVVQSQAQTFYAAKQRTLSVNQPSNTMVTANKSVERKIETVNSEQGNIQTSIDGPAVTLQGNIYNGEKPQVQSQCPRQPNWQPCISKQVANDRFRNCCLRLGEGCSSLCSYDSTLATIQLSVLTGRCPISKVGDMMVCASGYEDATPCCEAHNVFEPGFEHCKPYCNPAAGLPQGGMLTEKFKCLGKLSQIQRCFYVTQRP